MARQTHAPGGSDNSPLWTPDPARAKDALITRFRHDCAERHGIDLPDYAALWRWSIDRPQDFWPRMWDFAGIRGDQGPGPALIHGDRMQDARFFPQARLNYAENLLYPRHGDDRSLAITFRTEDGQCRHLDRGELRNLVIRLAWALAAAGVVAGDRVAGFMPNMPETVAAMLATASLGAIWTSCSPDFGAAGVLDRFGQSRPKILFAVDSYRYNGKVCDCRARLSEIANRLKSLEQMVLVSFDPDEVPDMDGISGPDHVTLVPWGEFLHDGSTDDFTFPRLPFNHPLFIMYSSGTTGKPKCITHGAGGMLLTHAKEHMLHCDVRPGDRVFYFTTCGWMMWNWLVSALSRGAALMLYDGAAFYPEPGILFDYADADGWTLFGTSAKYIDACAKAGLRPIDRHPLAALRTICSTGSPLMAESFDYVYDAIKADVHLASICGGTDIMGCFLCGDPAGPVWRGEIQRRALGMAVSVYDAGGNPVQGQQGELVCTEPFPSMPVGFWDDDGGAKYHAAYFARFANCWTHGDFVALTGHDGVIVFGRSDATLNPGGVRIGTAEIYRQVEAFSQIEEAIVIGQQWQGDTRIVLFVRMAAGQELTADLQAAIRQRVRENCSPRHMPAKILAVADIPRTRSGKITELAVRDVVHGRPISNREALANPEALGLFAGFPELDQD